MINIRPVSDLRNKYPEIEELVLKEDEAVYLTKNGYGSMVVLSLEKYSEMLKLVDVEKSLEARFGAINIDDELENASIEAGSSNTKLYTHEDMKKMTRWVLDDK